MLTTISCEVAAPFAETANGSSREKLLVKMSHFSSGIHAAISLQKIPFHLLEPCLHQKVAQESKRKDYFVLNRKRINLDKHRSGFNLSSKRKTIISFITFPISSLLFLIQIILRGLARSL